jgi:hypothetical protein
MFEMLVTHPIENIYELDNFGHCFGQIKHPTKKILDHVLHDNMFGRHAFQHEGKISGSVLCGLVLSQEYAMLDIIHIDYMMKNPYGRVGYPSHLVGI